MKSRNGVIFLIVLLAIAGGLLWLIDPWSTTGGGLKEMLPGETKRIRQVEIIDGTDTLVMNRPDSLWMTDGELLNQAAVENLVFTASHLKMKSIIPGEDADSLAAMAEVVFRGPRKEAGHFFIAPFGDDYVIYLPGSAHGYGVELPGYEDLMLEKVFSANPDHYRDHLLINLLPSEIRSVEVIPRKGEAFRARQDSAYNISVFALPSEKEITKQIDVHRMRLLFSYFNSIRYERVVDTDDIEGSTFPQVPLAVVKVTGSDGEKWKFEIYQWIKAGRDTPDLFHALVIFNDQPLLLSVNYYYLDLVMREAEVYSIPSSNVL